MLIITWRNDKSSQAKSFIRSERKFTKNIKIFLQLYMKADLLTCYQDLVRGVCYYIILT